MAYTMTDRDFEIRKLEHQRRSVELNVSSCELRLIEIEREKSRFQENIRTSELALKELDERINELKEVMV